MILNQYKPLEIPKVLRLYIDPIYSLYCLFILYINELFIISITRDNASNNTTFVDFFKTEFQQTTNNEFTNDIRCIAHVLNLAVHDILNFYIDEANSGIIYNEKKGK